MVKYLLPILFLATACGPRPPGVSVVQNTGNLIRAEDRENNIVCYHFSGYEGVSCIQLSNSCAFPAGGK